MKDLALFFPSIHTYRILIMPKEPLISDIPSIKKPHQEIKTFKSIKPYLHVLRPLFKFFNLDKLEDLYEKFNVDELDRKMEEIASLPDRFNDIFSERGWILFDQMDFKTAISVVNKAESGDINGAETGLINYFNTETITSKLETMMAVKAFRPRMPLAKKALLDFREGRYHACTPLVLALLDGMINEINQHRQGFFNKNVNLEAWDSIAGHSKGLMTLVKVLSKERKQTRTEQITIPFRHGIMHGMDLGYDNQLVAAKTWAALFAAREWAIKAERGLLKCPPSVPEKTWGELIEQHRKIKEAEALSEMQFKEWKPRTLKPGVDIPKIGMSDSFSPGTPEQKLAEYLNYWMCSNYGHMAQCLNFLLFDDPHEMPPIIKKKYSSKKLKLFEFIEIIDVGPGVTEIQTKLFFNESDKEKDVLICYRLLYLNKEGVCMRSDSTGIWTISNWNDI